MFLPLRCLVNLRLEASFVGLENGLETLSNKLKTHSPSNLSKSTSDDIYALLWELGSNVVKYGLKKSSQRKNRDFANLCDLTNPKNAKSTKSKKIDSSKICLQAFVYSDFVEISLHYKIGFTLINIRTKNDAKNLTKKNTKNAKSNMPIFISTNPPQMYFLRYDELLSRTKDSIHIDSSLLGNKVIAYLAEKICYDTPKIFFKNARERILRVRILPPILEHI
ncbi:hypothetical protein [Helicobacter sp. T3_23-1059]